MKTMRIFLVAMIVLMVALAANAGEYDLNLLKKSDVVKQVENIVFPKPCMPEPAGKWADSVRAAMNATESQAWWRGGQYKVSRIGVTNFNFGDGVARDGHVYRLDMYEMPSKNWRTATYVADAAVFVGMGIANWQWTEHEEKAVQAVGSVLVAAVSTLAFDRFIAVPLVTKVSHREVVFSSNIPLDYFVRWLPKNRK